MRTEELPRVHMNFKWLVRGHAFFVVVVKFHTFIDNVQKIVLCNVDGECIQSWFDSSIIIIVTSLHYYYK